MTFWRNKEVRCHAAFMTAVSVVATAVAFWWDCRFGIWMLFVCATLMTVSLITTYRRYCRIRDLSTDIDCLLHHTETTMDFDSYREGELAILQSELEKMTVRLREQHDLLLKDKTYLADSIADISHQLRTPLTAVNLLVERLGDSRLTAEERTALSRELMELLSRIDWLVTTLLKISRLDAGAVVFAKEETSLASLVKNALIPLSVPMELRDQRLIIKGDAAFIGDATWTSEAVVNIVKNCMEHTPVGGEIIINISETALYSELVIADSGSGIDDDDLPHIFERFYKGKHAASQSFGIGLALARMIILSQNGTIKAANSPDKGAVFTIRFYKGTV